MTDIMPSLIALHGIEVCSKGARLFHQFDETMEMVRGVVRPRRGLRVILNGEDGKLFMTKALDAIIVEVDVGDFDIRRQAFGAHREAVVMRRDLDHP